MKTLLPLFLLPVLIPGGKPLHAPASYTRGPETAVTSTVSFQHGEQLTYKIYYNLNFIWVPAGEVTFRVLDEGTQYHYQAKGTTYDSYEWFFTVNDEYDSWADKNTLLPNYSERSVLQLI